MDEFLIFVKVGLEHVLNIHAYDHLLFLIALTVPYVAKDWKRIIILVSCFTLGHTISLLLSVFNIIMVKSDWVVQNKNATPDHFLRPANFEKYLNQENEENKIKFAWQ